MKLFEKFKETIPSNTSLVKNACGTIIDNNHKISLKEDISLIVQKMHDKVYEDYKSAEIDSWKRITTDEKGSADILDFDELQNFFKSLGNFTSKMYDFDFDKKLGKIEKKSNFSRTNHTFSS